jgi:prepilin-type N-terminal cleavage/methylation domain-containing protein
MRRSKSGFTLVELLVVIIIIGIISSMGMANFIVARDRARTAGVRENMHTAQTAAEGYHTETTAYADVAPKMDPFFPGGAFNVGGTPGNRGNNPFSGVISQALYSETFTDLAAINSSRMSPPSAGPGVAGQIGYCRTDDGESYAICGLDAAGLRLPNSTGGTLILSNQ